MTFLRMRIRECCPPPDAVSLEPERTLVVYPVFAWLEIAGQLEVLGDGALASAIGFGIDRPVVNRAGKDLSRITARLT